MRKYNWKKILINTCWILAGVATVVLLGAAMQQKNRKHCADIKVEIKAADKHLFIDEKDVLEILDNMGPVTGNTVSSLNLHEMESVVEKNPWISNAEMFLDNNQVLQVRIEERQPVARVFTKDGNSFYLDSAALRLPLSEKLSVRVPMFTGFPSDKQVLARPDSLLLLDIVKLGRYIGTDSFWMAQVAQIDITPQSGFEMVPVVGDHIVVLGNTEELEQKFTRLYTFYRKAWLQNGINTYEKIDVQYDKQVVAVKRGTAKALVDSARAHEVIRGLLQNAEPHFNDSAYRTPVAVTIKSKVVKDSLKINTAPAANNKMNQKPLSKGKKAVPPKTKQPKPKAIMEKKE